MLIRYYLSLSYSGVRRIGEALRQANELLKHNPNSTYGYQAKGIAYLASGMYLDALDNCSRGIYLGSPAPLGYAIRGLALRGLGRSTESEQAFRAATSLSREATTHFDLIAAKTNPEDSNRQRTSVQGAPRAVAGTQSAEAEIPSAVPTTQTIWSAAATPTVPVAGMPAAVELGVKFRADVSGFVLGIRYFKGSQNTGIHTASLWSTAGGLIATATFQNETVTGWQEVRFASPVAITPNTTYVASYHTSGSGFAIDRLYFNAQGVDSGPLHALQSGVDGFNGVYLFGPSGFPNNSYQDCNYWVDVVFMANAATPGKQFQLQSAPSPPTSLLLFLNGLLLRGGAINYVLNGSTITFVNGTQVKPTDIMQAWYRY